MTRDEMKLRVADAIGRGFREYRALGANSSREQREYAAEVVILELEGIASERVELKPKAKRQREENEWDFWRVTMDDGTVYSDIWAPTAKYAIAVAEEYGDVERSLIDV